MNKRMIATSLALVLAMTVVLAVGKTTREGADPVGHERVDASGMQASLVKDMGLKTAVTSIEALALLNGAVAISSEIDENEIILEQHSANIQPPVNDSTSALFSSLARVQNALSALERVVMQAETAVTNLEEKRHSAQ